VGYGDGGGVEGVVLDCLAQDGEGGREGFVLMGERVERGRRGVQGGLLSEEIVTLCGL